MTENLNECVRARLSVLVLCQLPHFTSSASLASLHPKQTIFLFTFYFNQAGPLVCSLSRWNQTPADLCHICTHANVATLYVASTRRNKHEYTLAHTHTCYFLGGKNDRLWVELQNLLVILVICSCISSCQGLQQQQPKAGCLHMTTEEKLRLYPCWRC